jgi:hypothetical protein
MRFWIYFKGTNNGQLLVGYRYSIGDDITSLTFSNYQSCPTNATQCSWQRIEVPLSSILQNAAEVKKRKFFSLLINYFFITIK